MYEKIEKEKSWSILESVDATRLVYCWLNNTYIWAPGNIKAVC